MLNVGAWLGSDIFFELLLAGYEYLMRSAPFSVAWCIDRVLGLSLVTVVAHSDKGRSHGKGARRNGSCPLARR